MERSAGGAKADARAADELDDGVKAVRKLEQSISDNVELIEMGEAEGDAAIVADAEEAIKAMAAEVRERQIETMLSGEADGNDTYLEIHAGPAAPRARTGPTCCCACTPAGPNAADQGRGAGNA